MNIPIITKLLEAKVDRDGCIVEGVILSSGLSENGTWYSPEVVDSSAEIFRGVQCYADHPQPGETERSVRDVVGAIESAWSEDGKLRASIRLSRAHEWLLTMIGESLLGDLSINALGKTRVTRKDGRVVREVTEITRAFSVDFVARAAAGGHVDRILHESAGYAESLKLLENITFMELEDARPDLIAKLRESVRDEILGGNTSGLEELEKLQDVLDRRQTAYRRQLIASRLIENSKLPDITREFLNNEAGKIDAGSDEEYEGLLEGLIESHRGYIAALSVKGIIRGMGSGKESSDGKSPMERSTLKLMGVGGL